MFLCTWLMGSPLLVSADTTSTNSLDQNFNPNFILDDQDIFDLGDMNLSRIQNFLSSKGALGKMKVLDIDGIEKSPAEVIWRVSTSYKINPKYLMALIQKEQSLVEDSDPSQKQLDWAAGFGVCDSCSMNDPAIQNFKGFASQIEWAAKQHREKYLFQLLGRGTTISGYAPGKLSMVDSQPITPVNQATAMLYTYTPHLHGNFNLWNIWQRWFTLAFPDGSIVQDPNSQKVFLIRLGEKRPFKSMAAVASMVDKEKILTASTNQLASYPVGSTIAFANYSLVETPDHKRYLIVGDKKRLIVNNKIFLKLGFNEDEVVETTPNDLASYHDGPDITMNSAYPTGLLAKDGKGTYWYVEEGTRQPIPHKAFLSLYFKGRPAKLLTAEKFATLKVDAPYQLHEGELVRSPEASAVYVIEKGKRRPIASGEIFEGVGWKWKNVVTLPSEVLDDYSLGETIQLKNDVILASAD